MDSKRTHAFTSQVLDSKLLRPYIKTSTWTDGFAGNKSEKETQASKWKLCTLHLTKYCNSTSLHGFRYLTDPSSSTIHRLLWLCVIIAGIYATHRVIIEQIMLYQNKPILFSFPAKRTFMQDIPFPAVTVCSQNQMLPSTFNYSALLLKPKGQLTTREKHQLDFANYVCLLEKNFPGFHKHLNVSLLEEVFQLRNKLCAEEFLHLKWQRVNLLPPCLFLQPALSELGHCYTFNMVPFSQYYKTRHFNMFTSSYSTLENAFIARQPEEEYWSSRYNMTPWKSKDSSLIGGVQFTLNFRSRDYDETCNLGDKSFLFIIHPPTEMADRHHEHHVVRANSVVMINVDPKLTVASSTLQALPSERRSCFLPHEKFLRFFAIYSQRNCEVECHANWTRHKCGCVAYYHPRDRGTPICGVNLNSCVVMTGRNISEKCNCLPTCNDITYSSPSVLTINKDKPVYGSYDFAQVYITIPKKGVIAKVVENISRGSEVFGKMGGLLSLFLGASIVSLLEIIYFSSLWPLVTFWNYHKRTKRGKHRPSLRTLSLPADILAWYH